MYGDGPTSRDYTFVHATVSGILAALDHITSNEQVYEILNLGNNQPVKLIDLINAIGKVIGKEPQINVMPKQPGDVDITYASIEKAKDLLGYQPKTTLEEGLQHFLVWYEQQK
jgi:nucleoside-diphosphate-sugar epimerase